MENRNKTTVAYRCPACGAILTFDVTKERLEKGRMSMPCIQCGKSHLDISKEPSGSISLLVPCSLIVLSGVLTGLGIYQKIAKHAGAGTLVPRTGFANAISSISIDSKAEGLIFGVGANIFKIAGPVIVYGTLMSVIIGIVYWIVGLF